MHINISCHYISLYHYHNHYTLILYILEDSLWRHCRRDHSIKGRRENASSTSSSEACIRSMAPRLEDAVSHSLLSGNHGYICNLRRSLSRELRTASSRGRYGERNTHAAMLRGVQASKKASTKYQLYPAKGVPLGWLDGCQWHYPYGQRPELHTLNLPVKGWTPGPRVELEGLES